MTLAKQKPPTPPGIERLDPALDKLLAPDAKIEILAEGYEWSEGPIWVKNGGFLLFSDVLKNTVHRWKQGEGAKPYLTPSGYTSNVPRGGETGSNGLTLDHEGRLVLAQHGDRRVAVMDAPLTKPEPKFTTLADRFEGARFNSPNDLVFKSNGDLYFTDPAYGMEKQWEDPKREMNYAGVFRRSKDGKVTLLTKDMTRPNGLAFSPDEKLLYVAQSDPDGSNLARVRREAGRHDREQPRTAGRHGAGRRPKTGLPDGLKIDTEGNLWATGPGGLLVISPQGKHLGTIRTGQATANFAWGDDGHSLYITADMYLMRVKMKAKGVGLLETRLGDSHRRRTVVEPTLARTDHVIQIRDVGGERRGASCKAAIAENRDAPPFGDVQRRDAVVVIATLVFRFLARTGQLGKIPDIPIQRDTVTTIERVRIQRDSLTVVDRGLRGPPAAARQCAHDKASDRERPEEV